MSKDSSNRPIKVDGYICSYPKSGRTWIRFCLANLLNDHFNLNQDLNLVNQFFLLPNDDQSKSQPFKEVKHFAFSDKRPSLPLLTASHAPFDNRFKNIPVVFILRDPRDGIVSRYRHLKFHQDRFKGSLEEFLDSDWGINSLVTCPASWAPGTIERLPSEASTTIWF